MHLPVLALLLAVALPGGARAAGPERHIPSDASVALLVPTLERFSRQAADVLATATTFPGGQHLQDGRAVIASRLGFDPFDPAAVKDAGLDPRGAAGASLSPTSGEPVFILPVADPVRLQATLSRVAKERLGLSFREEKAERVAWRREEGGGVGLACAIHGRIAIIAAGEKAFETLEAAWAVPESAHLGTTAAYRTAVEVAGHDAAFLLVLPPGSAALKDLPDLQGGVAIGVRGAKDRLGAILALTLGAREAPLRGLAAKGASAEYLAKLDPAAALVLRGESNPHDLLNGKDFRAALEKGRSDEDRALLASAVDAIGGSAALALGIVPVADGREVPLWNDGPLPFFRLEFVLALRDPPAMKRVIRGWLAGASSGKAKPTENGPWVERTGAGEGGAAIVGDRLYVAAGPRGALDALLRRTGSTFRGPTPASADALLKPLGGMFVDGARVAGGLRAIPAAAFAGASADGQSKVQGVAALADRITAIWYTSELLHGVQRVELAVEVTERR